MQYFHVLDSTCKPFPVVSLIIFGFMAAVIDVVGPFDEAASTVKTKPLHPHGSRWDKRDGENGNVPADARSSREWHYGRVDTFQEPIHIIGRLHVASPIYLSPDLLGPGLANPTVRSNVTRIVVGTLSKVKEYDKTHLNVKRKTSSFCRIMG